MESFQTRSLPPSPCPVRQTRESVHCTNRTRRVSPLLFTPYSNISHSHTYTARQRWSICVSNGRQHKHGSRFVRFRQNENKTKFSSAPNRSGYQEKNPNGKLIFHYNFIAFTPNSPYAIASCTFLPHLCNCGSLSMLIIC